MAAEKSGRELLQGAEKPTLNELTGSSSETSIASQRQQIVQYERVQGSADKFTSLSTLLKLAVIGFGVGLCNAWRLPYLTQEVGRDSYHIIYAFFLVITGRSLNIVLRLRPNDAGIAQNQTRPGQTRFDSIGKGTSQVIVSTVEQFVTQRSLTDSTQPRRRSVKVKDIPLDVCSRVCVMLNAKRNVRPDDFRMLAEKSGFNRDEIEYMGQMQDPTNEILLTWSSRREATVGRLIELLEEDDFGRSDVAEVLENWVNGE